MDSRANIKAVISAKDEASGVLKKFGDDTSSIAGKIGAAVKAAALVTAAAGTAAVAFGVSSVKAFSEMEAGIAQTNAVLKSTGGIAGVTADQVSKLAAALQKTTKFSDEDVRSVENLLLTFTSIGKDIFPQATKTVLDMATALGEDTKSASIQLGKALQDPINGITALRRVGVNFNDAQKKVIENLVNTGHTAEAQKKILEELNKEFGGSAEAAGNTFAGALAKLKNQFNDVQEAIGKTIVQYLTPLADKASKVIASIDWQKVIDKTVAKLHEFAGVLDRLKDKVAEVGAKVADYLLPKFEHLWDTFTKQFIPAVVELVKAIGPTVGAGLVWAIGLAVDAANALLKFFTPTINFMRDNTWVVYTLAGAFVAVKTAMAIDAAVAAFTAALAVANGAMVTSAGVAGGLRLALLLLTNPIWITIGIVGVAAVIFGLVQIKNALQEIENKWNDLKRKKIPVAGGKFDVSGTSDTGLVQQIQDFFKGGFATGGFTGSGGANEVARIVHKGEYVLPQSQVDQRTGLPKAGSSPIVNITIQAGAFMGSQQDARKYAVMIMNAWRDAMAIKGTPA